MKLKNLGKVVMTPASDKLFKYTWKLDDDGDI